MKMINSKGRVLMQVTRADSVAGRTLYTYTGDGIGGYTDWDGLQRTIATVKADAPSARVVGTVPLPN